MIIKNEYIELMLWLFVCGGWGNNKRETEASKHGVAEADAVGTVDVDGHFGNLWETKPVSAIPFRAKPSSASSPETTAYPQLMVFQLFSSPSHVSQIPQNPHSPCLLHSGTSYLPLPILSINLISLIFLLNY